MNATVPPSVKPCSTNAHSIPKAKADPIVFTTNGGTVASTSICQHLIYKGEDNQLYELYCNEENIWSLRNITTLTNTPPSVGEIKVSLFVHFLEACVK
jgi:hypothetical protein